MGTVEGVNRADVDTVEAREGRDEAVTEGLTPGEREALGGMEEVTVESVDEVEPALKEGVVMDRELWGDLEGDSDPLPL